MCAPGPYITWMYNAIYSAAAAALRRPRFLAGARFAVAFLAVVFLAEALRTLLRAVVFLAAPRRFFAAVFFVATRRPRLAGAIFLAAALRFFVAAFLAAGRPRFAVALRVDFFAAPLRVVFLVALAIINSGIRTHALSALQ